MKDIHENLTSIEQKISMPKLLKSIIGNLNIDYNIFLDSKKAS